VIWIDGSQVAHAARSGEIVMLYHLLWELTHVVFEHPGLLEAEPRCTDDVCITCADEGRVAEVAVVLDDRSAEVVAAGVHETVDVSLVDRVDTGDLVLVHAGVAISVLQEPGL
jgi:hydrogenase maturation factor